MNIEIVAEPTKKVSEIHKVFIGGECVGKIEKHDDKQRRPFMAVIKLPAPGHSAYGWGEQPQAAVVEAISRGRKEAIDNLEALEGLQEKLFSERADGA